MDEALREELLAILRQHKQILDLLHEAYELGFSRGLLDDELKGALQ